MRFSPLFFIRSEKFGVGTREIHFFFSKTTIAVDAFLNIAFFHLIVLISIRRTYDAHLHYIFGQSTLQL